MPASEAPPTPDDATVLAHPARSERPSRSGADDSDPIIGVVLGGTFRVLSVLGEGAMGVVYEAQHLRLDRRFAVKLIHHTIAGREDLLQRFDREARAMSRVRSDHVVDVADVVRTPDGRPCIVTEKLEGEDLERHLGSRGGKVQVSVAVPLFRQLCRGLAAAHAQGIVHRDLKPSNLFLARDPTGGVTLKILDFGVAKVGGDAELTGTGAIVGTPAYMAPEQARGSSEVDARSDVYSAGAVLYRMLTGRAPYGANDAGVTLVRLLEESPERARSIEKSIPEALEAILERAMARDPEARYATIDAFEREVAAFDGGGSSTVVLDGASLSGGSPDATSRRSVLAKRARSVRPLAIVAAGTASVGACLAVGVCLALLVDGLRSGGRIHDAELVLVALGALVALGSSLFASLRAIRAAWRSAPAVERLGMRYATAVAAGLLAFGLLELTARVYAVLVLHQPGAWDPLWAASRVVLAIGAGLVGAAVGRRR